MKFNKGDKARVKQGTTLYKADDEPTAIGSVAAGAIVTVQMGPHMGRYAIKTPDGKSGWVANSSLEKV